ncbi:helix-turn-helix domain-containing protein [Leeuwenhoekiella marinoflava]|uniref:AraC family transcriptional regulator n=2 Tax=Leeuwenhoekiella marinoflava TaxID=988 RepID=A0A4Q0PPS7_9FLAO|nr:response regulator transcription factor [Leeuwenhoekiella marinoflava]RXG31815.1 AraC family transcriptional regulator [Leeuwenhoekiella marinoflava]SHF04110.1 AraC-type DNA-binding protein [Leeuwenhoekiella marinoflava DSM 3653]
MKPLRVKTISEAHRVFGLPQPEHPLISVIDLATVGALEVHNVLFDFYTISLKRGCQNKLYYGQQHYDFDEGLMIFVAPNQVLRGEENPDGNSTGWSLLIHPDLIWGTSLANTINTYEFFDYAVNEALFLSEKEERILEGMIHNIKTEYQSNIDKFSKQIIITQIESLLSYSDRFYHRQFLTRERSNCQILDQLEFLLNDYFNQEDLITKGLPSVQFISEKLNVSKSYLRSLLKNLTGLSTQQLIHEKLIEKAKEKLSTTELSISEIAYELGFEHLQSFSKLFKAKTNLSPIEFRQSFN